MNSSNLKIIAYLTMLIDHMGAILFPDIILLRIIGRLAFPIFAFLIVEGYYHTKNVEKYLNRLLIFALLSEIPFDLAFSNVLLEFGHQNVFFSLYLGLMCVYYYDLMKKNHKIMRSFIVVGFMFLSYMINSDYIFFAILMIFGFYIFRGKKLLILLMFIATNLSLVLFFAVMNNTFNFRSTIQLFAVLTLVFIYLYNGKKGRSLKYLFYGFYPVHLILLWLVLQFS